MASGQHFEPFGFEGDTRPIAACSKCLEAGPVFAYLHPERRARDDAKVWRLRFTHERCSVSGDLRVPWQIHGARQVQR